MKSRGFLAASAILAAFVLTGCNPGASEKGTGNGPAFHELTYEQALQKAKTESKVVMIDVSAPN